MAPTNPAPEGTIVVSAEDAEAQALADERQLEFRARHQLTIDAQAFTVLEPKYARELRARSGSRPASPSSPSPIRARSDSRSSAAGSPAT